MNFFDCNYGYLTTINDDKQNILSINFDNNTDFIQLNMIDDNMYNVSLKKNKIHICNNIKEFSFIDINKTIHFMSIPLTINSDVKYIIGLLSTNEFSNELDEEHKHFIEYISSYFITVNNQIIKNNKYNNLEKN